MMSLAIIRQNSFNIPVDAIVNITDSQPAHNSTPDTAIYREAGPQLLEARNKIGKISPGQCAVTLAFSLSAKYALHTVVPRRKFCSFGERRRLKQCYKNILHTALSLGCRSIAIPLLCTDTCRYSQQEASDIALPVFHAFLEKHDMTILLVLNDRRDASLSQELFHNVKSYIDDHLVSGNTVPLPRVPTVFPSFPHDFSSTVAPPPFSPKKKNEATYSSPTFSGNYYPCACPSPAPTASLSQMLSCMDAGFSETLLRLIDNTGKKDSYIYKKANVSKQHFFKIRNNPNYKPTKATAMAFAIALELDLDQTKDLIGRAGYALTNSCKFDVILTYFILHKRYDMYEINTTLFEFDQMTLGV